MGVDEKNLTEGDASPYTPPYRASLGDHVRGRQFSTDERDAAIVAGDQNQLHRSLKGRHMQMIAM